MAASWAIDRGMTHALLVACVVFASAYLTVYLFAVSRNSKGEDRFIRIAFAGLAGATCTGLGIALNLSFYLQALPLELDRQLLVSGLILSLMIFTSAAGIFFARVEKKFISAIVAGVVFACAVIATGLVAIASININVPFAWKLDVLTLSTIILATVCIGTMLALRLTERNMRILPAACLLSIAICVYVGLLPNAMIWRTTDTLPFAEAPISANSILGMLAGLMSVTAVAVIWAYYKDAQDQALVEARTRALSGVEYAQVQKQGLALFDVDSRFEIWNEEFLRIYRLPVGAMKSGLSISEFYQLTGRSGARSRNFELSRRILREAVQLGIPASQLLEMEDGRTIRVAVKPMANGGWLSIHEDLTEGPETVQGVAQSMRDPVTNLPNRKSFAIKFGEHISEAASNGRTFSLARIEVDRLKVINETFGELVGDAVLAELASRFRRACPNAIVARSGGVEFALLTSLDKHAEQGAELAARLASVLRDSLHINGQRVDICCFVGISVFPKDATDMQSLMDYARVALQCSKDEGRSKVYTFDSSMDRRILDQRMLQRDLVVALANNEFELYYQPQAAADGEILGFEVLLRWNHPKRGMISPAVFVPLAEQFGLIGVIDAWVLRQACLEATRWTVPLNISVNLSAMDFREDDVGTRIAAILNETGLNPRRLEVEVTEGVLIEDFDRAASILHRLKELGVSIAMDDFGSGYSSLSYLQAFPFDKIKIDRAFISRLEEHSQSAVIVQAIIALGRSLKMPTIAEGVETEAQRDFLIREGCDELQGYLIGRPQPISSYSDVVFSRKLKRVK